MSKRAISLTLSPDNLVWLEATALRWGRRSLSDALDRILEGLRRGSTQGTLASYDGLLSIDGSDPELLGADAAVRSLFDASHGASLARDAPAARPGVKRGRRR